MPLDFDLLGEPIPEGWNEPGRPPHMVTEKNRNKVILLLACGWTIARIAPVLGITTKTLRKHYSPLLKVRAVALDRVKAGHLGLLWEQCQAGNVAALKEIGKVIDRLDAANFGVHGDSRSDDDEDRVPRGRAIGKKEEANQLARSAGAGSDWGNDLLPHQVN